MSQKPLLAFVVGLILVSSGCLGFGDEELEQQENDNNEKQEPVGETNMTSLEKRIEHLESTIAEYEQPKVYFQEFGGDDVHTYNDNANLADDGNLFCSYNEYYNENSCLLVGITYDINGIITSFSWESSKGGQIVARSIYANSDSSISYAFNTVPNLNVCDTDVIDPSHGDQIITLTVYDNDGNSASASYAFVDYDSVCTVEEPDNTCMSDSDCPLGTICIDGVCMEDTSVCVDSEQMTDGGWVYTCVGGQWGPGEPVPDGTACDDGDPDTEYDVYTNGTCVGTPVNHPPEIHHLVFAGGSVTNETDYVCLDLNVVDEDDDEIQGVASWLINGVFEESLSIDECFDLGSYNVAVGDELSVQVTVSDGVDTVTATHAVIIEEEPE